MFNIDELEIIKASLEGDIVLQKKQLEEIDDIRFEMWLLDTQEIHKKVSIELMNRKAKVKYLKGRR